MANRTPKFVQGDVVRYTRTGDKAIFVRYDGRWGRIYFHGDPQDDEHLAAVSPETLELVYRAPEVAADA